MAVGRVFVRGILLAGGTGSRLWPMTAGVSKQLLPVYDKPLIYYPLSTLMLAGIREVLVITAPSELSRFQTLLGDGHQFGISIDFAVQAKPNGIAEALVIGAEFIGSSRVCLILGDNIFYGNGLRESLRAGLLLKQSVIYGYWVEDPREYAVVEIDPSGTPTAIREKPNEITSHLAVPGLYFYPPEIVQMARDLKPGPRGELEITDLNENLLRAGDLHCEVLPRGSIWLDAGSTDTLLAAGNLVQALEKRQGMKIACPEELGFLQGWLDSESLKDIADYHGNSPYGRYLMALLKRESKAFR